MAYSGRHSMSDLREARSLRTGSQPGVVPGARALFAYHAVLFTWWVLSQVWYRVAARLGMGEPALPAGAVNLAIIVTALVVMLRFALGRRGTAAGGFAGLAAAMAAVDVIGETLQFAPLVGLPAFMPGDKSTVELLVRLIWVTCEFVMRTSIFVALWRSQTGAPWIWPRLFAGLAGVHWVISVLAFARSTATFAPWWDAHAGLSRLLRVGPLLGLAWLLLIVLVNRRVARLSRP